MQICNAHTIDRKYCPYIQIYELRVDLGAKLLPIMPVRESHLDI